MATLKYSRQRESIKEFLTGRTDHPTADFVYENMKQIYPNISLGTVYRNPVSYTHLHPCQQKLRRRKQDGHPFQKTACNPGGTHWSDIRCLHRFLRCRRRCIYFACFYHAYQTGSDHSFRQYQGQ